MKKLLKHKLVITGKKDDNAVAVGWSDRLSAIVWFWNRDGENPLKNAKEYVRWKSRRKK